MKIINAILVFMMFLNVKLIIVVMVSNNNMNNVMIGII